MELNFRPVEWVFGPVHLYVVHVILLCVCVQGRERQREGKIWEKTSDLSTLKSHAGGAAAAPLTL